MVFHRFEKTARKPSEQRVGQALYQKSEGDFQTSNPKAPEGSCSGRWRKAPSTFWGNEIDQVLCKGHFFQYWENQQEIAMYWWIMIVDDDDDDDDDYDGCSHKSWQCTAMIAPHGNPY